MICMQCKKYGKCGKPYSSISNHAEICKDFEEKKQTNFEKIKSMSIDEMARLLMCPAEYDLDFNKKCNCNGEMNKDCNACCKQWLESEVDVNDKN